MLERKIYQDLDNWLKDLNRKPLILKGARQVGKSYAVEEFARRNSRKIHKINFQANKQATIIFQGDLNTQEIIRKIEYLLNDSIDIYKDIVFFDEIQECPKAINSLKFFCEELPELIIISAGSYLGLMKNEESFPVGKIDYLFMFPLTFEEFLQAVDSRLYQFYQELNIKNLKVIDNFFHQALLEIFYLYLAVGGMPDIIQYYINLGNNPKIENLNKIRKNQNNLLESYKSDFAKHAGVVNSSHILHVYEAVFSQLSKSFDAEVDKFKFSQVIPNQKGYERIAGPLSWLTTSRLIIKNYIISNIELPLKANNIYNKFKLFVHDVGLLNACLDTPISSILENKDLGTYKGYIAENFVATQLYAICNQELNSFVKGESEIEFVIQYKNQIIPLEVKSSIKSRKAKSLDSFIGRFKPKFAYKLTAQNFGYHQNKGYCTLPLYLVSKIFQ